MTKPFITQERFAEGLISYVKKGTAPILEPENREVAPDHWVANMEKNPFSDSSPNWDSFQRQYLSPLADLLDRLYQECQYPGSHSWNGIGNQVRNDFHMNQDFRTQETQEKNYQHGLRSLENRKLLNRQPTRRYKHDSHAVSVLINNEWVDIPGSYRMLRHAIQDMKGIKNSMDFPRIADPYGQRIPVMFAVGSTVTNDPEHAEEKALRLFHAHRNTSLKFQEVIYVLAERINGLYTARHIGRMVTYILKFVIKIAFSPPKRHSMYDRLYDVPQPDLSENELKSLETSMTNWEGHHPEILENHPGLKSHIMNST